MFNNFRSWLKGLSLAGKIVTYTAIALVGGGIVSAAASGNTNTPSTPTVQSSPQAQEPVTETKTVTEKSVVPFSTTTRDDSTLASGTTKTSQEGVDGERTITYNVTYKDGVEQSKVEVKNEVTTATIDKVVLNGTYVYVAPTPTPSVSQSTGGRTGATCKDGTHSNATGSGACSHHGGVSVWLY